MQFFLQFCPFFSSPAPCSSACFLWKMNVPPTHIAFTLLRYCSILLMMKDVTSVSHVNSSFAPAFDAWYPQVYTCCFLLTRHEGAARQVAMQIFLHLGAAKESFASPRAAELALFGWLLHNCEDFYYRKLRRLPRRSTLAEQLSFPPGDNLYALLRQPLPRRTAFALHHCLGCTLEESAALMKKSPKAVAALFDEPSATEMLSELCKLPLTTEDKEQMESDIYLRFSERSVGVENKLRDIRTLFQRLAVVLAVLVLGLFVFSVYYATKYAGGG